MNSLLNESDWRNELDWLDSQNATMLQLVESLANINSGTFNLDGLKKVTNYLTAEFSKLMETLRFLSHVLNCQLIQQENRKNKRLAILFIFPSDRMPRKRFFFASTWIPSTPKTIRFKNASGSKMDTSMAPESPTPKVGSSSCFTLCWLLRRVHWPRILDGKFSSIRTKKSDPREACI